MNLYLTLYELIAVYAAWCFERMIQEVDQVSLLTCYRKIVLDLWGLRYNIQKQNKNW